MKLVAPRGPQCAVISRELTMAVGNLPFILDVMLGRGEHGFSRLVVDLMDCGLRVIRRRLENGALRFYLSSGFDLGAWTFNDLDDLGFVDHEVGLIPDRGLHHHHIRLRFVMVRAMVDVWNVSVLASHRIHQGVMPALNLRLGRERRQLDLVLGVELWKGGVGMDPLLVALVRVMVRVRVLRGGTIRFLLAVVFVVISMVMHLEARLVVARLVVAGSNARIQIQLPKCQCRLGVMVVLMRSGFRCSFGLPTYLLFGLPTYLLFGLPTHLQAIIVMSHYDE